MRKAKEDSGYFSSLPFPFVLLLWVFLYMIDLLLSLCCVHFIGLIHLLQP